MSRWMPPLLAGCVLASLPGCLHQDQDQVALAVAHELAMLPRDTKTQSILNAPRPKIDAKQFPIVMGQQDKLTLPPGIPGIDAPPIVLPPPSKKLQDPDRDKAIQALYPTLPALDDELKPFPGPFGQPLDLPTLQQIALAGNPTIQQAAADVQAACGGALQVGLYPNPSFGLQWDSIGQGGTIGQPGAFFEQTIKTGGKLELARAAGMMDVRSAQLALRRTQLEVMSQVRQGYFAVLVAQENLTISRALATLAEAVYGHQIKMVQAGVGAAYEPLQAHNFAGQARSSLIQARNRYLSAWRQLAAALGQPELPPTQLEGHAEAIVPGYEYDALRAHMLAGHTDLGIANNGVLKSRILLELARTGVIPDINTQVYVQKDHTTEPKKVQAGVLVGIELPVRNLNQGNILKAQAELTRANLDMARTTNDLSQRLADAYERYRNSINLAAIYRDSILPNQVRTYRAIYQRYQQQGDKADLNFNDVVMAQQTLSQLLQTYVQTLQAQWQAVVDLATLAQTDDVYQLTTTVAPAGPPPTPVAQLLNAQSWASAVTGSPRIANLPASPSATTQVSHVAYPQVPMPRAILAPPTALSPHANRP